MLYGGKSRCLFSDKYKTHKYSVGRTYNCWMLNCWCITWPVGFKRLKSICSPFITPTSCYFQHIPEHIVFFVPSGVNLNFLSQYISGYGFCHHSRTAFSTSPLFWKDDLLSDSRFAQHPSHASSWCIGPTGATVITDVCSHPSISLHNFLTCCTVVRQTLPVNWQ